MHDKFLPPKKEQEKNRINLKERYRYKTASKPNISKKKKKIPPFSFHPSQLPKLQRPTLSQISSTPTTHHPPTFLITSSNTLPKQPVGGKIWLGYCFA